MSEEQVEQAIIERMHQEPFLPFLVELDDGQSLEILRPNLAICGGGAGFVGADGALVDFEFRHVRALKSLPSKSGSGAFTPQGSGSSPACELAVTSEEQVEQWIIDRTHQDPFIPFLIELNDGQVMEVRKSGVAICNGGAVFFGVDGALVDFEFKNVRALKSYPLRAAS